MFIWAMRDKGSEWQALSGYGSSGTLPLTPLVEAACERFAGGSDKPVPHPNTAINKFGDRLLTLADTRRVWVDVANLLHQFSPRDVAELTRTLARKLVPAGSAFVPVVRTSMPREVIDVVLRWAHEAENGLCIRVDGVANLQQNGPLVESLADAVADGDVDLIVDAQSIPRAVTHEEMRQTFRLATVGRTWGVIGGTFFDSIGNLSLQEYEHTRERAEWIVWREQILEAGSSRAPMFGDFATQPSIYAVAPGFAGSASVRYTTADNFVVLRGRGRGATGGVDHSQFIGHARFLKGRPYYGQVVETVAEQFVERIAIGKNTGNMTGWRVASFQRHHGVVAAQVAAVTASLR